MGKESTGKPKPKPFVDLEVRGHFTPEASVAESSLSTALRKKIGPDLTEHELLEMLVITVNKLVEHLMAGSDEDITEDDISWP